MLIDISAPGLFPVGILILTSEVAGILFVSTWIEELFPFGGKEKCLVGPLDTLDTNADNKLFREMK